MKISRTKFICDPQSLVSNNFLQYKLEEKKQILTLEHRVQELEKQLFEIQQKKEKKNSEDELDLEDEETPEVRPNQMPDIRINKKKKGAKSSLMVKEILKTIKEKDEEIIAIKDQIKKNQMKIKIKDKEIFKMKSRLKKWNMTHATQ